MYAPQAGAAEAMVAALRVSDCPEAAALVAVAVAMKWWAAVAVAMKWWAAKVPLLKSSWAVVATKSWAVKTL